MGSVRSWWPGTPVAAALLVGVSTAGAALGVGGGLKAWAGEAKSGAMLELDAGWRSFAADLGSASGCTVRYESPLREPAGGGSAQRRLWQDHGTVGMLRIGAPEGPAVLVMPEGFLVCTEASQAYQHSGLSEPRRFAQELVAAAAFQVDSGSHAQEGASPTLSRLLETRAVLLPVCMAPGGPRSEAGHPRRNFPVRWDEAARRSPEMAGPYPGSHPGVRALTAWLHTTLNCATLLKVTPGSADRGAAGANGKFPAGSLEAFCSEVLQVDVRESSAERCIEEITRSLRACRELALVDPTWTRLGAANWSLDVTVSRSGATAGRSDAVLLAVRPIGTSFQWTAAATALSHQGEAGRPMELLPLRREGVLLEDVQTKHGRRVRLFFSGSPERAALAPGATEEALIIEIVAISPQAQRAVLRATSPL